jgi:ABC-type phosphate transport system auxiliary subunit
MLTHHIMQIKMANKDLLRNQINDLNNQISTTGDQTEKKRLESQRDELQRQVDA